jgi:PhnB protein
MASVSTYLHFSGNAEEAFQFYRSVFGTQFEGPTTRFKDVPCPPDQPAPSEAERNLIVHVALPIVGGHILRGSDAPEWLGSLIKGKNVDISLHPDTRAESDRLFAALSAGGKVECPLQDMFWGGYFGSCIDKFGINWMINCEQEK